MNPISVIIKANVIGPHGRLFEEDVRATIVPNITKATLAKVASWRPDLEAHHQEDSDWDWTAIVHDLRGAAKAGEGTYEFVALRARQSTQSLIILETRVHRSPRGKRIVYVEYLAVAPWNRQSIQSPRLFSGCGSALMEFAIRRSEDLGYDGRVGLHSLPGSRTFYARSGFVDIGPDDAEGGLHYFEYPD
jgi:hypothetical protein